MTTFQYETYAEDPSARTYRLVEVAKVGDQRVETRGPLFRVATQDEQDRVDSVVVYDPDDFEPRRLVPVS